MLALGNSGTESEGGKASAQKEWGESWKKQQLSPLISFPTPYHWETESPHLGISLWLYFGLKGPGTVEELNILLERPPQTPSYTCSQDTGSQTSTFQEGDRWAFLWYSDHPNRKDLTILPTMRDAQQTAFPGHPAVKLRVHGPLRAHTLRAPNQILVFHSQSRAENQGLQNTWENL